MASAAPRFCCSRRMGRCGCCCRAPGPRCLPTSGAPRPCTAWRPWPAGWPDRAVVVEVDEFVGGRATVPATPGGTLDQDVHGAPEVTGIDVSGDALLQQLDFVQAAAFLLARHVVDHLRRGHGPRAGGVHGHV